MAGTGVGRLLEAAWAADADRRQHCRQRLGKPGENERAKDRAKQRADPADDRPEDDLDRAADVEDLLGEKVVVVEGEEHAGQRRHARGNEHRDHLAAEGVDPQGLRRLRILADGQPVIADAGAQQPRAKQQGCGSEREHEVIEHRG